MFYLAVMKARPRLLNRVVASTFAVFLGLGAMAHADEALLDELFARLPEAGAEEGRRLTRAIWMEWSKSGSPAMDLLLARGQAALRGGEPEIAVEHFTALIDHAPDFAEGYNARATAYFQTGDYGPSVADIARTLALNPRHFGALSGLGMIFEAMGRPERALEAYRAALSVNPHLPDVEEAVARLSAEVAGQDL